ncbi:MAG: anaerobic ribonucleoside-triphosphate reductase activating protein [bacterium]|nr:anaerobic ribonucleoside-triphosphate reductase activating protein [bacterium]
MTIRLAADLQVDSIVDGEGIRTVIWTQGCPHNCQGCHNPLTHSIDGGAEVELDYIKEEIDLLDGQDGITFSGGDPFLQPLACSVLAKYAKTKGLNIWCYTGYTFEQLLELSKVKIDILTFLKEIDVLVDGKFEIDKKSYSTTFRGSSNQRIIDVPNSLKNKQVVLVEKYDEEDGSCFYQKPVGVYI